MIISSQNLDKYPNKYENTNNNCISLNNTICHSWSHGYANITLLKSIFQPISPLFNDVTNESTLDVAIYSWNRGPELRTISKDECPRWRGEGLRYRTSILCAQIAHYSKNCSFLEENDIDDTVQFNAPSNAMIFAFENSKTATLFDNSFCNNTFKYPLDMTRYSSYPISDLMSENEFYSCGFGNEPFEMDLAFSFCMSHPWDTCCKVLKGKSILSSQESLGGENIYFQGPILFAIFCALMTICSWLIGFSVCSSFFKNKKQDSILGTESPTMSERTWSSQKTLVNHSFEFV